MERREKQIKRVERYEEIFDKVSAAARRLDEARGAFDALAPDIEALEAYYTGAEWKRDFAADEAGKLPPELKRGVLSEDAVYDLLEDVARLRGSHNEE